MADSIPLEALPGYVLFFGEGQLKVAIMLTSFIFATVKLNWILPRLAVLAAIILLGAGCSGINASRSVSPLSFFLPGLVQNKAPSEQTPPPISPPESANELAQAN